MALYACIFAYPYIVPAITTDFSVFFAHVFSVSALYGSGKGIQATTFQYALLPVIAHALYLG
jgi:hypothetical protein